METAGQVNFPKMEKQFELEWLFLEDHLLRQMEVPLLPPIPLETNLKCDLLPNFLLQYPDPPVEFQPNNNQLITQKLENFDADFCSWNECPPLSEDSWKPISQLPPSSIPSMIIGNNQFSYTNNLNNDFNDQTLNMVVAEGFKKVCGQGNVVSNGDYEEIKRENHGINCKMTKIESLRYDEIRKYFDMPISKAAKELNVGLTVLKKRCRELNIKRWPHRKIKSLKALINNVKEMGMVEVVEVLEEHRKKLQLLPEMELTEETKKLRQACFKANYKKRRALALTHL